MSAEIRPTRWRRRRPQPHRRICLRQHLRSPRGRAYGVQSRLRTGDGRRRLTLTSFAAAFLGSAALKEGQFHILGTLIGVLTVAVGNNGLAMIGAPIFTQYVFSGRSLS